MPTVSGLKTNLGLLDNGISQSLGYVLSRSIPHWLTTVDDLFFASRTAWGYTILLCVVAFVGKFAGCAGAARLNKFGVRESLAIGTLMSCKGSVPSSSLAELRTTGGRAIVTEP